MAAVTHLSLAPALRSWLLAVLVGGTIAILAEMVVGSLKTQELI
jgi:hypothetical protein